MRLLLKRYKSYKSPDVEQLEQTWLKIKYWVLIFLNTPILFGIRKNCLQC